MPVDYYNTMVFAAGFGLVWAGLVHLLRLIYWQAPRRRAEYQARQQEPTSTPWTSASSSCG